MGAKRGESEAWTFTDGMKADQDKSCAWCEHVIPKGEAYSFAFRHVGARSKSLDIKRACGRCLDGGTIKDLMPECVKNG